MLGPIEVRIDIEGDAVPGYAANVVVEVGVRHGATLGRLFVDVEGGGVRARRAIAGAATLVPGRHVFMAYVDIPARLPAGVPLVFVATAMAGHGFARAVRWIRTAPALLPGPEPPMPLDWRRVCEHAAAAWSMDLRGGGLSFRVGAVEGKVLLNQRWSGRVVVGALSYPPLGMALRLGSSPWWGEIVNVPPLAGTARDGAQATTWTTSLWPAIATFVRFATADDRHMTVWQQMVVRPETVGFFVTHLRRLAGAVDASLGALPAPTPLRAHVAAWRRLAAALDGRLRLSDLSIAGAYRGHDVWIQTAFVVGGHPTATRILFKPRFALRIDRSLDGAGGRLAAIVWHLALADGVLVADLPPLLTEPDRILDVLHRLDTFAATLALENPYR